MKKESIKSIKEFLETTSPVFKIEGNKYFESQSCDLYANRKAGMAGQDFVFIYDLEKVINDKNNLESIHESNRKFANSFYKMPKWFRFSVPNIVTIFVSENDFSKELIDWAQKSTRTITGGEFHSIFLIDLKNKSFYGQGTNRTYVPGSPLVGGIEFKTINPQNRAHYLIASICDNIFKEKIKIGSQI